MADTNRVGVRIVRDSTRNAPLLGAARTLQALRYTGAPGLAFTPTTIRSEEIRSDRQTSDLILVGGEAGGDTNFELSFAAFDLLIESALMSFYTASAFQLGTGAGGIAGFGAGTIDVDTGDGARYLPFHLARLTDLATGDQGGGVYQVDSVLTDTITASAFTADTNALAAGFVADADTRWGIVGMRATANADIAFNAPSGGEIVMTFAAGMNSLFDNARDTGVPLAAGEWLKISGFATAENNVWARIKAVDLAARTLTFDAQTGMAADAATTEQVELYYGDTVENGTGAVSAHQFAVERRFEDTADVVRELFTGMALNNFSLNLQPQALAAGSVTFFGFNSSVANETGNEYLGTVPPALYENPPIDKAAPLNDVYNTSSNVGRLGRGVDPIDSAGVNFVLEASIDLTNNLRRDPAVGVFGAANIGAGEVNVTGNLRTYFDNKDILQQILDNSETSLDLSVVDNSGQAMLFDMPRIKFAGGAPDVPGKNQSVTIPATYEAILDPDLGYTISVQRFYFVQ